MHRLKDKLAENQLEVHKQSELDWSFTQLFTQSLVCVNAEGIHYPKFLFKEGIHKPYDEAVMIQILWWYYILYSTSFDMYWCNMHEQWCIQFMYNKVFGGINIVMIKMHAYDDALLCTEMIPFQYIMYAMM